MKKEDISVLAQLLTAMKEGIGKMEEAQKRKDAEQLATIKREMLMFQQKIEELI